MSEVPPTVSQGAEAPTNPPGTPRLSDEAESMLQRRHTHRARAVAAAVNRLNLHDENDDVRHENEIIIASFRKTVTDRYGPSIAERTAQALRPPSALQPTPIDRRRVIAGFENARLIHEKVRARPEVRPFLPGGDQFSTISRRYELTSEKTVRNYESALIDGIVNAGPRAVSERLAKIAETAAADFAGFTVRRELDHVRYQDLAGILATHQGELIRIGYFSTTGIPPTTPFAHFGMRGPRGIRISRPPDPQLKSQGDKVHLSVNKDDVPKAWSALQPLLLSRDSPFLYWKVTLLTNEARCLQSDVNTFARVREPQSPGQAPEQLIQILIRQSERITEGMQFTLYAYAGIDDPDYARDGPKYRHFLRLLDRALAHEGVRPGRFPESDVPIEGFAFATYRNELIGTRGTQAGEAAVTPEMLDALEDTAFFRAMNR